MGYSHPFIGIDQYEELNEPPRGKTNNVVSEQVRHKPACRSRLGA